MNISVGKSTLQDACKIFRRLPNSCLSDMIRGSSSIRSMLANTQKVISATTSMTLPRTTTTVCRRFLRFKSFSKSRFISTAKDKYLNLVGPIGCNRFISTRAGSLSKTDSLTELQLKRSALSAKIRKKVAIPRPDGESGISEVVAYVASEEIYLDKLDEYLATEKLYEKIPLPSDGDAIYVKALYEVDKGRSREVFFFREGAVVFWNMSFMERKEILQQVRNFCETPFDFAQILGENESLNFSYSAENPQQTTTIKGYEIQFSEMPEPPLTNVLEKYAFSDALGLSVKLALWEQTLVRFVESIEPLIDDLRSGRKIENTRDNLLRKTGELFTLRHFVNLSSDLLDTPDFYWDREGLEPLYAKTINYLNVAKRTRVINEKLKHCCELIELLSDHLNDRHHTRLEVMIIVLIMVEVMFEIIHYIEKYYHVDPEIQIPTTDR